MPSVFDDPEFDKRQRDKELQKRRETQRIRALEDRELEKQGRFAEQEIAKRSMFQRLEQTRQQTIQRFVQLKNTLLQNHIARQQQIREQSHAQNRAQIQQPQYQQSRRDNYPSQTQQQLETRTAEREAREHQEQQEQPTQKSQNQFAGGFSMGQGKPSSHPLSRLDVESALRSGSNKLVGANLAGTDLSGLDFRGQFLRGTNFQGSNLDGADFSHSELQGADLQKASAKGARFESADMSNIKAAGANFSAGEFDRSNLQGASLQEADFSNARFSETSMDRSDLKNAKFNDATMAEGSFEGADMKGADFSDARSKNTSFSNADMRGAHLASAGLEFSGRDGGPDPYDTSESCRFQGTKLHGAALPPSWEQNRPDGPLYADPNGIPQRETELAGKLAEIQERYDAKILHSTGMADARWRAESQLQAHADMCNERASVIEDAGKNAGTPAERDRMGRQSEAANSQAEASQTALSRWRSNGQITDPQHLAQVRKEAGFSSTDNQLLQSADAEHEQKSKEQGQGATDYGETIVASMRERRTELSSSFEFGC